MSLERKKSWSEEINEAVNIDWQVGKNKRKSVFHIRVLSGLRWGS
jgi:hypothetical protein